jgi:hypothetical protein
MAVEQGHGRKVLFQQKAERRTPCPFKKTSTVWCDGADNLLHLQSGGPWEASGRVASLQLQDQIRSELLKPEDVEFEARTTDRVEGRLVL